MHFVNRDKEWFVACLKNNMLIEKIKKISLIISDIDGSLTDGKVFYRNSKEIAKSFSIQDGFLIAKCNKPGMPHIAFISGRSDSAATHRAQVLGIPDDLYYQGVDSKKANAVITLQKQLNVQKEETLFFGDDLLDLETKEYVGILASPSNGLFYVHAHSDIIVPRSSGNGAFRLLLDLILYAQDKHIAKQYIDSALQ